MKLKIIETISTNRITSEHVMWTSLFIFFAILGSYSFEIIQSNFLMNFLLIITAIIPLATNVYGNFEYFPQNFKYKSDLILGRKYIQIGATKIEIEKLDKIEIFVNDWHGKKIVENVRPIGSGPNLSRGVNNTLNIYFDSLNTIKLNFQIESKDQFNEIALWVSELYRNKIEIIERYDSLKSYGLKHLNFAEIQKFKMKYTS